MKELFKVIGVTIAAFISIFYYVIAIFMFCEMLEYYGYAFENMRAIGLFLYVIFNIIKPRSKEEEGRNIGKVVLNALLGTPFVLFLFYIGVGISLELLSK